MIQGYASYFSAFLIQNTKNREQIQRIILYGSVAKGEETRESDVDIFIELKRKNNMVEKEIREVEKKFYDSREAVLFKLKGIENKINIKIGALAQWRELYGSIASTGIVLYGPYEAKELPSGVQHNTIIYWDKIEKNRGAFLNILYGFRAKNKKHFGILEKIGGARMGKSCILIPTQYKSEILKLIQNYRVHAKIKEVYS